MRDSWGLEYSSVVPEPYPKITSGCNSVSSASLIQSKLHPSQVRQTVVENQSMVILNPIWPLFLTLNNNNSPVIDTYYNKYAYFSQISISDCNSDDIIIIISINKIYFLFAWVFQIFHVLSEIVFQSPAFLLSCNEDKHSNCPYFFHATLQ